MKRNPNPIWIKLSRSILILLVLSAVLFFASVRIVDALDYANTDFFSYWLAGYMNWVGQSPYSVEQWVEGHHEFNASWISDPTFLYPLPLAVFFAPLGLLSLHDAFVAWVFLSQIMILLCALVLLSLWRDPTVKHLAFPVLAGIVLFRPTIITLTGGQLGAAMLLSLTLMVYFWEKGEWFKGSVFMPLLALKPNIGLPIVALLGFWLLMQRQKRALLGIAVSSLVLLCAGFARNPNWIADYLTIGNDKLSQTFGYSPTVWGVSANLCGFGFNCTLLVGGVASAILLIGCLYILATKRFTLTPAWVVSCVIVVTLLVTPYTWPYDQILLILPLIVLMMGMMRRQVPFLLTASVFLLVDLVALGFLIITARVEMEIWNAVIPFIALWALGIYLLSKPKRSSIATSASSWAAD